MLIIAKMMSTLDDDYLMTSWNLHTNQRLMACLSKGAKGLGAQVPGAMGAIGTIRTLGAAGAKGALQ